MAYGLNPTIFDTGNPNSPFYEDPCEFCKRSFSECPDCKYNYEENYTDEELED